MSTLTHPLQHISEKDHDRRFSRSRRHCQQWRENNYHSPLCLVGDEEELAKSVECLDKASTVYGMELNAEMTRLMTNNTSGVNKEIKVNGQKLETITSFEYMGSVVSDKGSKPEILSKIAQATAALTRLKPVWNDRSISLSSKIQLMRSLVTSFFVYAWESWALTAELQKEYKPLTWGATARYYAPHTKTMLPTRKSVPRSCKQSDQVKTWPS